MQASVENIWESAQHSLRAMLNPDIYNLWFQPVKAVALEEETLVLEVANDFCEVWLKDNYLELIRDVVAHASGQILKIRFRVGNAAPLPAGPDAGAKPRPRAVAEPAERAGAPGRETVFNPKNTFENFVVGENNNHAHAAALAVAQAPGKSYNPLFF